MDSLFNNISETYFFNSKVRPNIYNRKVLIDIVNTVLKTGVIQTVNNIDYRIAIESDMQFDICVQFNDLMLSYEALGVSLNQLITLSNFVNTDFITIQSAIDNASPGGIYHIIQQQMFSRTILGEVCTYYIDLNITPNGSILTLSFDWVNISKHGVIMIAYLSILHNLINQYLTISTGVPYKIMYTRFMSKLYFLAETDVAAMQHVIDIQHTLDRQSERIVFEENSLNYSIETYVSS